MASRPKLSELKLDEKEWPELRRLKVSARRGWEYAGMILREIYKNYGAEGIRRCFNSVMCMQAEKYFLPTLKALDIKGNDCKTVASYFILADIIAFPGFEGFEVIEDSPRRVVLRAHQCPFSKDPAKDFPVGICENSMGHEQTAAKLVDPKMRFFCTKFMSRGDPYCEMGFEIEN